jgi:hypothetical protein
MFCDIIFIKTVARGNMETKFYTLTEIEGEYAYLTDEKTGEKLFIAMMLLPLGSDIGSRLKYEDMSFELI